MSEEGRRPFASPSLIEATRQGGNRGRGWPGPIRQAQAERARDRRCRRLDGVSERLDEGLEPAAWRAVPLGPSLAEEGCSGFDADAPRGLVAAAKASACSRIRTAATSRRASVSGGSAKPAPPSARLSGRLWQQTRRSERRRLGLARLLVVWKSPNRWEDRQQATEWKIFRRSVIACRDCRVPGPPTPVESRARFRVRSDGYTVQGRSPGQPSRRAAPRGPSPPSLPRSSKRPPGRSSSLRAPASGPTSESSPEPRPCASA